MGTLIFLLQLQFILFVAIRSVIGCPAPNCNPKCKENGSPCAINIQCCSTNCGWGAQCRPQGENYPPPPIIVEQCLPDHSYCSYNAECCSGSCTEAKGALRGYCYPADPQNIKTPPNGFYFR